MPSENTKILEFKQHQKSDKAPFIIYADLERIMEKIDGCENNAENSLTTKVSEYIPSGFSMFTISTFRSIEHKHDVCRGKKCVKRFWKSSRDHAIKIFSFKNQKIISYNQKSSRNHTKMQNSFIFVEKKVKINI